MHEPKKQTKEDESDSESEVQQKTPIHQIHQRKRKTISDSTPARRSKRHDKARIV